MNKENNNPECKRCGLLKSTILATDCPCLDYSTTNEVGHIFDKDSEESLKGERRRIIVQLKQEIKEELRRKIEGMRSGNINLRFSTGNEHAAYESACQEFLTLLSNEK